MIETKQRDLLALALAAVVVPATAWWVMAGCSSNPKKPETPAQPAPAEPAPEQVAKEAQPAGPVGEPGTYTIANLERTLPAGE